MQFTRKEFALGLAAMAAAGGASGSAGAQEADASSDPTTPRGEGQETYFFKNSSMEFVFLIGLGRAYNQGNNIGKMLWLSKQVKDGDFDGAFLAFKAAGDEAAGDRRRIVRQGPSRKRAPGLALGAELLRHRDLFRRRLVGPVALPPDVGGALCRLAPGNRAFRSAGRAGRDPLRGHDAPRLLLPRQGRHRAASAADHEQRQRRLAPRHVDVWRRRARSPAATTC